MICVVVSILQSTATSTSTLALDSRFYYIYNAMILFVSYLPYSSFLFSLVQIFLPSFPLSLPFTFFYYLSVSLFDSSHFS